MSRIHEALKKAQEERAALDIEGPGIASITIPQADRGNGDNKIQRPFLSTPIVADKQIGAVEPEELWTNCQHLGWNANSNENVFSNPRLGHHAAEQFRTLRSRLNQIRDVQPLRRILITSALPAEGKTFVSYNLAQAIIRQPDRRVLIIDADLRKSQMHILLGAPSAPGLGDYLSGEADEVKIIQNGREGNLFFIPAGKQLANPSELLTNGRLKLLLDRLSPAFDWVIVDSPPCLPVADSNIVGQQCDGVLLVVLGASTPAATAQRALQELQGRNVVGVVLNALENESSYGSSYYGKGAQTEKVKSEAR